MEKIYEQNGKKKQSFFQQLFNDKGSMVAVVVVAIVAVVGLVAFGFNQISYAAGEAAPEVAFTSAQGDRHIFGSGGADLEFIAMGFTPFMKDSGEYVICTEFLKNYIDGNSYSFSENLTDAGLKYLITELDKKLSGIENKEVAYWLKQSAVWTYLYAGEDQAILSQMEQSSDQLKNKITEYRKYTKENLMKINYLYTQAIGDGEQQVAKSASTFWADYGIEKIYDKAVSMRGQNASSTVDFSANIVGVDGKFSISDDGKYYVSSEFGVVSSNSNTLTGFSLTLGRAPEGTAIYKADGKPCELVNGSCNANPADKFRVMVPVDKVTDENKAFIVYATANFKGTGLAYYGSGDFQKVIAQGPVPGSANTQKQFDINYTPTVPDTGLTTAQTIYFIGLIILLSGVGIIYANAKPQEEN